MRDHSPSHYPKGAPYVRVGERVWWCGRTPLTLRHAEDLAQQRAEELKQRVWVLERDSNTVLGTVTP